MPRDETTYRLSDEIDKVITYFRTEYEVSLATVVGVLHHAAFNLMAEVRETDESEDGEDDE